MKVYFILILVMSGFLSCNKQSDIYNKAIVFNQDDFVKKTQLKGNILTFENTVMKPIRIEVFDSILMTINSGEEKHISLFNLNTKTKIGDRIVIGNGPEDMLQPSFVKGGKSFQLYDIAKKTLFEYDIYEFISNSQPQSIRKTKFKQQIIDGIARDKNENIIAPIFRSSNIFCLLNNDGQEISRFATYPETKMSFTDVEKRDMFQFTYAITPNGKTIVCYSWTDLIDIYSKEGKLLHRLHGPEQFFSPFKETHRGKIVLSRPEKGKQRDAYYNPVIVGDRFYVLFNGNLVDDENYTNRSNQIFVFSLEGKPLESLVLDQGIITFTVDLKNRKIYGISDEPEFHIVEYEY
ncbi:MAG: hypothetical protein IJ430_07805 [Parabacteroides sp.]|nr:hypothetical protein [Parabacteroides sp.]